MANILNDLNKKIEAGYSHIDANGNYIRGDRVQKDLLKLYMNSVKNREIDPISVSFSDYFNERQGELLSVDEVVDFILSRYSGEEILDEEEYLDEEEDDREE